MLITPSGEDEIIICDKCKYAANVEKATSIKSKLEFEEPLPSEEVITPGIKSIEELSKFLKIEPRRTLKVVLYSTGGEMLMALIRGDLEINEIKLKKVVHCTDLRLAREEEVEAAGLVAGFVSPVGLNTRVKVVADDSVVTGFNFVAGGNKKDTHLRNVNYLRDFKVDILQDIARAKVGEGCPRCGNLLSSTRGIEVGHIF